jgi:hypothetical protein
MRDPRVVPFFERILRGGDAADRRRAVDALARHRKATAVVPLWIDCLTDDSDAVRATAARRLAESTGKDFGRDAEGWRAWWEAERKEVEERESRRREAEPPGTAP